MYRFRLLFRWIRAASVALFSSISLLAMPLIAGAQSAPPPLRVLLLPRLIPDAIRQMLPLVFDAPGGAADVVPPRISVVAMVYCGGDSAGNAYAIGLAVPGQARALSSSVLSANDCTAPLPNVAARLMGIVPVSDWLEVIQLRAAWVSRRLTLAVADAAGAARPRSAAPNLKNFTPIKSYDSSGIRILTGPGRNVGFDLAVGFPGSAITV